MVRVGDEVTVVPAESDAYVLQFQRCAVVSRVAFGAAWVRLPNTHPPDQEFGPIPLSRLLPGWRDERGNLRSW
ncbi:MAG TPA: hypothetical protein VGL98_06205 [Gammaproteobacteria bacterium]